MADRKFSKHKKKYFAQTDVLTATGIVPLISTLSRKRVIFCAAIILGPSSSAVLVAGTIAGLARGSK
jgi:hypothetical protein